MVQNSEWGPPLWRILHALAERLGKQRIPMLATDELRAWIRVLQGVETIMPCPVCKQHYREWRKAHPFDGITGAEGSAQTWLWELHEDVNNRRGIEAEARVQRCDMTAKYGNRKPQDIEQDVETLIDVLKRAALERVVDGAFVLEWRKRLTMLRRLVGV